MALVGWGTKLTFPSCTVGITKYFPLSFSYTITLPGASPHLASTSFLTDSGRVLYHSRYSPVGKRVTIPESTTFSSSPGAHVPTFRLSIKRSMNSLPFGMMPFPTS